MTAVPDGYRMSVAYASEPAPERWNNEDFVIASNRFVVVLDGASHAKGMRTGCIHDVPWLVNRLGTQLADVLANCVSIELADAVALAIDGVRSRHAETCDLDNPDSPSSTVAVLRLRGEELDYLVLGDSAVVLRYSSGQVTPVCDDRVDHLPNYSLKTVREARNAPGGFWVASTNRDAAYQAIRGSATMISLESVGVLTDGLTRLVGRHGWSWSGLFDQLRTVNGPEEVIRAVRRADEARTMNPSDRGKRHDDATAVICRFEALRTVP